VMARENNWFTFPPNPVANPELFKSHTHWRATQVGERFSVITWRGGSGILNRALSGNSA
jgi:hypothetical protein